MKPSNFATAKLKLQSQHSDLTIDTLQRHIVSALRLSSEFTEISWIGEGVALLKVIEEDGAKLFENELIFPTIGVESCTSINRLQYLLDQPTSPLVLKSSDYGALKFRLTSGWLQEQFVALQLLFKRIQDCHNIIRDLAVEAVALKETVGYTAIIACTVTAKFLLDRIHSLVEDSPGELSQLYLGNFPYINPEDRGIVDFRKQRVLILTDVVASGSMVANLVRVVRQLRGTPVAILAAVVTNPNHEVTVNLPLRSLAYFNIRREKNLTVAASSIVNIDPITVMPVENSPYGLNLTEVSSAFGRDEMLAHFRQSDALRVGFFLSDHRRFFAAVDFDSLFDKLREGKIPKLHDSLESAFEKILAESANLTVATTCNVNDVKLLELANEYLERAEDPLLIPKRDTVDDAHGYYLLNADVDNKVKGKDILLLLSSINTGEKLISLATLLASHEARRIHIYCLVNRLGAKTSDFVRRMQNLLKGRNGRAREGETNEPTGFKFEVVYDLEDIGHANLEKLRQTVDSVFSHYLSLSRVPAYRSAVKHEMKYFEFKGVTGKWGRSIEQPAIANNQTEDELMYLAINTFVAGYNTQPLIDFIRQVPDRDKLYKIFGVVATKLNGLKVCNRFKPFRKDLLTTIKCLRAKRFEIVDGKEIRSFEQIREIVSKELSLLMGVALFSYLDEESYATKEGDGPDHLMVLMDVITCDQRDVNQWLETPKNLAAYFSDGMVGCVTSLILHFSQVRRNESDVSNPSTKDTSESTEVFRDLVEKIETYKDGFTIAFRENGALFDFLGDKSKQKQYETGIRDNADNLLTELGRHQQVNNGQLIRFLQKEIIYTRNGHNPYLHPLEELSDELHSLRSNAVNRKSAYCQFKELDTLARRAIQKLLMNAIFGAGGLAEIADALPRFFGFTPANLESVHRFATRRNDHTEFEHEVSQLEDAIRRMREGNRFTKPELDMLDLIRQRVESDFYAPTSILRRKLYSYIVPLHHAVRLALESANRSLNRRFADKPHPLKQLTKEWLEVKFPKLENIEQSKQSFVLIDRGLMVELMKNLFTNTRHVPKIGDNAVTLDIEYDVPYSFAEESVRNERLVGHRIVFRCVGGAYPQNSLPERSQTSTMARHREEIAALGGCFNWSNNASGTEVELILTKRNPPKSADELKSILENYTDEVEQEV